jgi:hypothetical protein
MSNRPGPEREVYVAWQVKHGHRPDGWWFVVEVPGRPAEEHGPSTPKTRCWTPSSPAWRSWSREQ